MIIMANFCMHVVISMKYVMTHALIFLKFLMFHALISMKNSSASLSPNLMNHVRRMGKLDPFLLDRNVRGEENL